MADSFASDIERVREILKLMESLGGNDPASAAPWLRLQDELESLMNNRVEEWLALASVAAEMRHSVKQLVVKEWRKTTYVIAKPNNMELGLAAREYDHLMNEGAAAQEGDEC